MLEISGLVAVILVVCEAIKRAGLQGKYVPLLAVVLGIVGSVYLAGTNWLAVASGVVVALATSGAYGAVKGLTKEY